MRSQWGTKQERKKKPGDLVGGRRGLGWFKSKVVPSSFRLTLCLRPSSSLFSLNSSVSKVRPFDSGFPRTVLPR